MARNAARISNSYYLQRIGKGNYQLVIVSPELLLHDERFEGLWAKKQVMDNVINIVLDEAHVIKEWGGTFRTDYLKLGPLRYQFPRMIPYNAGSATVGNEVELELIKNLHLRKDSLAVMRHNTDRPNIFLVVERMKHPANLYEDLAFLIKKNLGPRDKPPPKFLVFFNSRAEAQAGAEYLRARLSPELRGKIKWFHSGMTDEFREEEMHALIIGESFGEGSTDAAGMVSHLALRLQ